MATEQEKATPDIGRAATRPPTAAEQLWDKGFRGMTWLLGWGSVALLLLLVFEIGSKAVPQLKKEGLAPLTSAEWNPAKIKVVRDADGENTEVEDPKFGLAGPIFGTLYSPRAVHRHRPRCRGRHLRH
jgi:phosphate transport system permease protein